MEQRVLSYPSAFARVAIASRFPVNISASFTSGAYNILHKLDALLLNTLIEQCVLYPHIYIHLDVFSIEIHIINFLVLFLASILVTLPFISTLGPLFEHIIELFVREIVVFFISLLTPFPLTALYLLGV